MNVEEVRRLAVAWTSSTPTPATPQISIPVATVLDAAIDQLRDHDDLGRWRFALPIASHHVDLLLADCDESLGTHDDDGVRLLQRELEALGACVRALQAGDVLSARDAHADAKRTAFQLSQATQDWLDQQAREQDAHE